MASASNGAGVPPTESLAAALRRRCDGLRAGGARVGFVPTMGALHAGHLSLVQAVREAGAERIVVSIFVNPLQFAAGEDLDAYPRTLRRDLALLADAGVDLVYTPSKETMYPPGFQTHVEVEQVTQPLEGRSRPTHFRGVTTVVAKLFHAVGPCIAAFGEKDFQQLRVLTRMVVDLDMPVTVLPCPIHREADGLAMSSRNRYLTPDERTRATAIHAGLLAARDAFAAGERDAGALVRIARAPIDARFDSVDYVTLADPETLLPLSGEAVRGGRLLVAARLGQTRLIDNMAVDG